MSEETPNHLINGYAHNEPFEVSKLQVSSIHTLYYEQFGSKTGLPVIFLHGGPGGQISTPNTKFFNPDRYRVVLFDQRGTGKSTPRNELRENTTEHLIGDIEKLREHLRIPQWHMVFGGSWGSTLGLSYTQAYPTRVRSIVLRGVFTARACELAHSRQGPYGAARFYPEIYDRFLNFLPKEERQDPIAGYYKLLTSGDPALAARAAQEWNRWDITLTRLHGAPLDYKKLEDLEWCITHAMLETHFFTHGAWLREGQLLEDLTGVEHIACAIVQGRHDMITPPATAWELHKAWPNSSLYLIDHAGHSPYEPNTQSKLVEVCDRFADLPHTGINE